MTIKSITCARILITGMLALALFGCGGSSEITHSYVDPKWRELDLHGVLVVAVTQQDEARIEFENSFARALDKRGVRALASHTLIAQHKASAEEVIAAAAKADLDTILVTRYIGATSEEVYHPGTVYYGLTPAYGAGHNRGFGGYYAQAYEVAYQQPVWTNNVTHSLVSDLYVASTREHLWQAVSETLQAGSTRQVREDAIHALIGDLKEQGLLR